VLFLFWVEANADDKKEPPSPSRTAVETAINGPSSLALDHRGHLFVIEYEADRVLQVDVGSGLLSVVVGGTEIADCAHVDKIPAANACLQYPESLTVDSSDNLYIGELAGYVRKVDFRTGLIMTVAGNGKNDEIADGINALSANLGEVEGIAFDSRDNLFIADKDHERILKLDATTGLVTRFAGSGSRGFRGDGGPALEAAFSFGSTMSFNQNDDLVIADFQNCRIRQIEHATGIVTTVALTGTAAECDTKNLRPGPFPSDPVTDSAGNVYFIEGAMDVVRRIDAKTHQVTTIAGTGARGFSGDGGPANRALLNNPSGLAIDSEGNLYVAEFENNRIRRVDAATGVITTIAGNGYPGHHPTID